MLDIICHDNHPTWTPAYKKLGRENGAKTYSDDIVKFYIPVFEEVFKDDEKENLVITVNNDWKKKYSGYDRIFLFVHERGIDDSVRKKRLDDIKTFAKVNSKSKVYFIVWSKQQLLELKLEGLNAIYLPMAIDVSDFIDYSQNKERYNRRVLYFGNIIGRKVQPFNDIKRVLGRKGYSVDFISENKFNGRIVPLEKKAIREIISNYRFGIAVGRSAQELSAMGLKVICYAYGDSMIADSDDEAQKIMAQNCTSWGEGMSLEDLSKWISFDNFNKLRPLHKDIREVVPLLRKELQKTKRVVNRWKKNSKEA